MNHFPESTGVRSLYEKPSVPEGCWFCTYQKVIWMEIVRIFGDIETTAGFSQILFLDKSDYDVLPFIYSVIMWDILNSFVNCRRNAEGFRPCQEYQLQIIKVFVSLYFHYFPFHYPGVLKSFYLGIYNK